MLDAHRARVETRGTACVRTNGEFLRKALETFVDNELAPEHLRIPSEAFEAWRRDETSARRRTTSIKCGTC